MLNRAAERMLRRAALHDGAVAEVPQELHVATSEQLGLEVGCVIYWRLVFRLSPLIARRKQVFARQYCLYQGDYLAVTLNSVRRLSWRLALVVLGTSGFVSP